MDINATNDTSNITGSVESYSYPTQAMIISGLDSGTTYSYCVILYNITDMMEVGEPVCGNFTTIGKSNCANVLIMNNIHTTVDILCFLNHDTCVRTYMWLCVIRNILLLYPYTHVYKLSVCQ